MHRTLVALLLLFGICVAAQDEKSTPEMPGMNMSGASGSASGTHDMAGMDESTSSAMRDMEGHHMDMGPHMKMTTLRQAQPGDQQKADGVVKAARSAAEKYQDYKVALADGFKIFLPKVPQKMYHFTSFRNALYARNHFDPSRPTSLLYEKRGDDYKLIGVMYTAKKGAGEDELDSRIPLSVAQWHAHVNFCRAPRELRQQGGRDPRFGFAGSISTKAACDAAGGTFYPQVFGWMVHVYPFEANAADIWSVERQHSHVD